MSLERVCACVCLCVEKWHNIRANVCTALKQRFFSVCLQAVSFSVTVNNILTSFNYCRVDKSGFLADFVMGIQKDGILSDFLNIKQHSAYCFRNLWILRFLFRLFCVTVAVKEGSLTSRIIVIATWVLYS